MKSGKSMQELCEWSELKTFFDRRLAAALGHPVREHILAVLNERTASGTEIGEEVGADVSSFFHHLEQLEKLGCIERVESRRNRGAKEHFFRATRTVYFDDEAWGRVPQSIKADLEASSLQRLFDDVVAALETGTLNARNDRHVSWSRGDYDAQGWSEAQELLSRTLTELTEIQAATAVRLANRKNSEPTIKATMSILAFERP